MSATSGPDGSPLRRLVRRLRPAATALPFDVAWDRVSRGAAPPLPAGVRPPALLDSRLRLRAAYLSVPVLAHLHDLLPQVVVEAASVDVSDHLDGDYWPDQRLIRVECHHPIDVVAFTLLHEFGHAVDHELLDHATRDDLGHPGGIVGWRDGRRPWEERGEEWLADSFAHWWWPARHEAHRPRWRMSVPPVAPRLAEDAFDLPRLAGRARW